MSNTPKNYYQSELGRVVGEKGDTIKIKILNSNGKRTKWLNLNSESIESFEQFLKSIEHRKDN